jgi:hypothetical protein
VETERKSELIAMFKMKSQQLAVAEFHIAKGSHGEFDQT